MIMADEFKPRDFIFCGMRRISGNKLAAAIRVYDDDGRLSPTTLIFETKKKSYRSIGGKYTGALFNDNQCRGLDASRYVMDPAGLNDEKVMWEVEDKEARAEVESIKLEADNARKSEIEDRMKPLARVYHAQRLRGNHAACSALERAVMLALRTGKV